MNTVTYSPETQRIMNLFDANEISPNMPVPTSGGEGGPNDVAYTAGGVAGTREQLAEWREQGGVMAGGVRRRRRATRRRRHPKRRARSHRRLRRAQ